MSDVAVGTEIEIADESRGDPVLFLQAVERHYRQGDATLHILNGAELAIWAGQSVALVAPSGAGKSTLLHIAGLLEHPDHGDVFIDGRPTAGLPDSDRTRIRRDEIGFVYQSHRLLPEFSALENVMLPQMIRGLTRGEANARSVELLSYLGLARTAHASAGGTVRRRAAARRDRARGRQRAAGAVCGRADRKPRSAHRRSCFRGAHPAGAGLRPRHHRCHPQYGVGLPDGSTHCHPQRSGGRDVLSY